MSGVFKVACGGKQQSRIAVFTEFGGDTKATLSALDSQNCDFTDGQIKNGVGIQRYAMEFYDVDNVFVFDPLDGNPVISGYIDRTGEFYQYNNEPSMPIGFHYRQNFGCEMKPIRAFAEDKTAKLIAVGKAGVYEHDKETRKFLPVYTDKEISCARFWQSRLFCATGECEIIYSAPGNPTNFTQSLEEGGSILFPAERGKIVGLEVLKDALFVFYDYGIAKLTLAGSPKDFVWEWVGYGGGKIVPCSIASLGDKIFFLAEDGAYRFDGYRAKKTAKELDLSPSTSFRCDCGATDGRYYAVYQDNSCGKRALAIDGGTEKGFFFFIPDSFCFWQGEIFCCLGQSAGLLKRNGTIPVEGYFTSNPTDFGVKGLKSLKKLTFYGQGRFEFTVSTEGKSESFSLQCWEGKAEAYTSLRGEEFSLDIRFLSPCSIYRIDAETVSFKSK